MSFGSKNCECNLEPVSLPHGSSMNEKFQSLEKTCFELRMYVKVSGKLCFQTWKNFLT